MSQNITDKNGNAVTSFSIGDDGIVYGFMGGPSTGYRTTSLSQESCQRFNFTFTNNNCLWRNESFSNTIVTDSFNSVQPISFNESELIDDIRLKYDYVILIDVNEMEDVTKLGEYLSALKVEFLLAEKNSPNVIYNNFIYDGANVVEHLNESVGVHLVNYGNINERINNIQMSLGAAIKPSKLLELWVNVNDVISTDNKLMIDHTKDYSFGYKITNYFNGLHLKLDNIIIDSEHRFTKNIVKRYTKNPSFEFERYIDNKKTWSEDDLVRRHENNSHSMQYTIGHEGEVLNTKELELSLTPNDLIVNEFWKTVLANKRRLIGVQYNGEGQPILLYKKLNGVGFDEINTLEEFKTVLFERLTNPVTSRTTNHYHALETLKNRFRHMFISYINYDYPNSMLTTRKIDRYWLDMIEEFVPSTALWGSSIKVSNNLFNDNKFNYKSYTLNSEDNGYQRVSVDVEFIQTGNEELEITNVNNVQMSPTTKSFGGIQETNINI